MLNPFFTCTRTINFMANTWISCTCFRSGENWALFCGDSEGSISVYANNASTSAADNDEMNVVINKRWKNIHRLAISHIMLVAEQNFLVSLSFDCCCQVLDSMTGSVFITIENSNRTR